MAETADDSVKGVPIRLYFQLEPDQTADAEVIARASLAFIAGVKEIAFILDPSVNVQVGIEGHTAGSLWEDLLLISSKISKEYEAHPIRYNLALGALIWIMQPPAERIRDQWWEPVLEKYLPDTSEEERQEVLRVIKVATSGNVAVHQKQQFYREIGRDTAITGVGVNVDRVRPHRLVLRSEFPTYSGETPIVESEKDRTRLAVMRVTIVSPVLEISNRRWKFATPEGEFGATVKDKAFLERMVEGQTPVRMRGGVQLDVLMETRERLQSGVWTIVDRNVIRVDDIIEPPSSRQGSMFPRDGQDH